MKPKIYLYLGNYYMQKAIDEWLIGAYVAKDKASRTWLKYTNAYMIWLVQDKGELLSDRKSVV